MQATLWEYPEVGKVAVLKGGDRVLIWERGYDQNPECFSGELLTDPPTHPVHAVSCLWLTDRIDHMEDPPAEAVIHEPRTEPILVTAEIRAILKGARDFRVFITVAGYHSGIAHWQVNAGHCILIGRSCRDITRAKARAAYYINSGRAMARLKYLTT